MSLVGNFAFGNYDRTAETSGAQDGGTGFLRRSSLTDQDPVREAHREERRNSLARTISRNRQASNASATERPTVNREATYTTAQTHLSRGNTQQDGLYTVGATPINEKIDEVDRSKAGLERTESDSEASAEAERQIKTDKTINELARSLTRQSTWSHVPGNPFEAAPDSELDPNSPNFKARS